MMKEVYRAAEKAFLSIPQNVRDYSTVRITEYYLQSGLGHGFRTNKGRYWGHKIMTYWYEGKPTPLSKFAEGLFDGFTFNFEGLGKLPDTGVEILVVNQPNTGPLRGNWFKFLVNYAVAERRGQKGNYEARWVQKELSDHPLYQVNPLGVQRARLSRMINKSCNTIIVGSTLSDRENLKAVLAMRKQLKDGGVLVICPEGRDNKALSRGKEEAGELIGMLAKRGTTVRPAGAWNQGTNLNVNFGDPLSINTACGQELADLAMVNIARLIPKEVRGVYEKLAAITG